jgi:Mrp family chromosome partitioning ATPase
VVNNEQILDTLRQVIHPELGRDLVTLGMVKDAAVEDGVIHIRLALPSKNIPIQEDLVQRVRQAAAGVGQGLEIQVDLVEMTQEERAAFLETANEILQQSRPLNQVDRVVAVVSGKGGVGKSSVTALLATALNRQGKRVGVLDADITGPSQPKMFGVSQMPTMGPLGITPVETRSGILMMSINLLLPSEDEAVIWRGPLIGNAIQQFWNDVAWGALDFLVVDLPPGTSDASLTVMQSIPLNGVILVTSPQDLAGMVVRKAARMAQHMSVPIVGLVENMSYVTCPRCGERIEVFGPSQAAHTARLIGVPVIGQIPLDPELSWRCDAGEIEGYPTEVFAEIAEQVVKRTPAVKTTPIFPQAPLRGAQGIKNK